MGNNRSRLLIVDDEVRVRDVLVEFLSVRYDCVAVRSAEEALELLVTSTFDVILSDINMARMSGLQMIPQSLKLAPEAVVVMISGQRDIEFAIEAMRAGAFDYITKPFDLSEVDTAVRRASLQANMRRAEKNGSDLAEDRLIDKLQRAIEKDEFILHYQPQVNVQSRVVVGAEALIRWQDPEAGLLGPASFIPLAEKTGLILPLGKWVMRAACAQAERWRQAGHSGCRIAINLSPRQLQDESLIPGLEEVISETGINPRCVELELTESSIIEDRTAATEILQRIRKMGIRIAIDDFGTGYSSLGYLRNLPIDTIKLDRCFLQNATDDPDDAALVMSVVTLAHNLRLKVLAEGIETEAQFNFLRLLRCDEGQGYFFGRPSAPASLGFPLAG